ncbi:MAG: glucan biosynthesis protein [Phenylobacterium sp.]|uniref:glucan biosynthesis protein n=1 Tax=Phenylobacterium sp. TaxID=1871053 RepID=UPI0027282440|nr:glucan biosynthesis protein [Phenylobacterium sp.]MDO9432660.1 glucan biosynthesis protein [Phenylobacterium sp.]
MIAALPLVAAGSSAHAARKGSFGEAEVQALARDLARRAFTPPSKDLPQTLAKLDYDAYRDIRFDPAQALWKAQGLPFQLQFFHRGGLFREQVDLYELRDGQPTPIAYSTEQFNFKRGAPSGLSPHLGFAGFRIHAPINKASYFDEVAVFLGASYFRAVAKGMLYGLSARGLAIGTGGQEEFPIFRSFWIERPELGTRSLTILALLDSVSCTGAFKFVVTPGETTIFDVSAKIFPRRAIANVGIAPLTSMFLFAGDSARRFDDFRPRVHDSDGLSVSNGRGERLWRPLVNPQVVQTSAFQDKNPRGFGLVQRERRLAAYQDLEARYDLRPSLWVEPKGAWGPGQVRLVELPAATEYEDNIAAFWTPTAPLRAGSPASFAYRLHWGPEQVGGALARVVQTRSGAAAKPPRRRFVIDFDMPAGVPADGVGVSVTTSHGEILEKHLLPNPATRGLRLSFELDPGQARGADLRAQLAWSGRPCSEVWLYRWTA